MSSPKARGRFITFEGLDGSGKSTQVGLLASALEERGIDVLVTREPGGTLLGEEVRKILLDPRKKDMSPHAELALMFACRAQLLHEVIAPALENGRWVLCDRFVDSSEAYQGGGRQLGSGPIRTLHATLARNFTPWLTFLLDGDLGKVLGRAQARDMAAKGKNEGRFEAENAPFFERVQSRFREIAEREPHRVCVVDADQSIAAIHRQILDHLDQRLRERTQTTPEAFLGAQETLGVLSAELG
jgi:dTMP kinase